MKTQQHTPTPWINERDLEGALIKTEDGLTVCEVVLPMIREFGYDQCTQMQLANAAFIVRACNSHEALVAACKAAQKMCGDLLDNPKLNMTPTMKILAETLAAAGGA